MDTVLYGTRYSTYLIINHPSGLPLPIPHPNPMPHLLSPNPSHSPTRTRLVRAGHESCACRCHLVVSRARRIRESRAWIWASVERFERAGEQRRRANGKGRRLRADSRGSPGGLQSGWAARRHGRGQTGPGGQGGQGGQLRWNTDCRGDGIWDVMMVGGGSGGDGGGGGGVVEIGMLYIVLLVIYLIYLRYV
jgi:hypothetical protein